ncbi:TolC family protein [Limisphaera ngatamarikiensis]|uniref:TolC family protein n=1 Tax=Limisphaera ngatamarikiensis TaxID=1324935 RepID=A0A6M1RTN7_9BACT|nr:TolC family protein [Limisphaera ngatamarikiensis]NGO38132.1 TolC family protein [Limisphaera ngatamarikiensis]
MNQTACQSGRSGTLSPRWARLSGLAIPLAALVCLGSGCGAAYYQKAADRAAYAVIREKGPLVPNMEPDFTLERTNLVDLESLPINDTVEEFLGPDGINERGARRVNLEAALALAVSHSRAYQARKEQLYLSALSLTLTRHNFVPVFSASGQGRFGGQTERAVRYELDQTTGELRPVLSDNLVEERSVSGSGQIQAAWLIRDVGRLSASLTTSFLRFLSGGQRPSSQLTATFIRPLVRDAGYMQQMEALTQAERQILYDLREFVQYRRDFSVQIASAYYNVLGERDRVRNAWLNLQSSRRNAERTRALAGEGRVTQTDLGRLAQQELSAESAWINAVRSYKQALDNFKLQLGLPLDTPLVLDDHELESLQIRHPDISVEDSIRIALAARLDYQNAQDQFVDAERKVQLAANMLKPRVDLTGSVTLRSDPDDTTGLVLPDPGRYSYAAGLDIDPGLDKTSERNAYRAALIARDQAARRVEQLVDEIKLQVRDSWRALDQAKRNYEISEIGVRLAERRVDEQNLLAELGRARAQDLVDAQNDLVNSRNQRTQALVAHTIARLQFWNNLGILYIKDRGQWQEVTHVQLP